LHVAVPTPRDDKSRPAVVPESVLKAKEMEKDHKMSKEEDDDADADADDEDMKDFSTHGDDDERPFWMRGQNKLEWNKKYQLKDDEWKFDPIPEIIDGKNIADYIDPEIMKRLEELEKEEDERMTTLENEVDEESSMDEEDKKNSGLIREKKKLIKWTDREKAPRARIIIPRKHDKTQKLEDFEDHLSELGIDASAATERIRSTSRERGRKRSRVEAGPIEAIEEEQSKSQRTSRSRSRSRSKTPAEVGLKDYKQIAKVETMVKKQQKERNRQAKKGEGDRVILTMKPKHLFVGKRGLGKTDRR